MAANYNDPVYSTQPQDDWINDELAAKKGNIFNSFQVMY